MIKDGQYLQMQGKGGLIVVVSDEIQQYMQVVRKSP